LRVQDYLLNQKFPNQAGAGNTTGGFGTATGNTGGFGSAGFGTNTNTASGFGTQNNTTGTGLFGATNTNTGFGSTTNTGFGSAANSGTGLFGPKPAGTGLFGAGATTGTNTTGTGLFGAANNTTNTGGTFGTGTGFGAANNTTTGTGLFGSTNTAAKPFGSNFGTGGTGAGFGQTAQPATGFGAAANNTTTGTGLFGPTTGTTGFGQSNATPNTSSPFGGFGQQNQQQQAQQNATGAGGGLFGGFGNAAKPATTGGFGGFGTANTTQPTNSLFGGAQNQTQTQPTGTGLFNQQPAPTNTGTGLFGQTKPPTSGLFGGTTGTTGTGLFGNTQQNTTASIGTGLFAPKPATTGTGLFGTTGTTTNNTGTGLFGNTLGGNNNAGSGLFGGGQQQQQPQSSGLFGNSMLGGQQQQQQNFSTSVNDQGAYGHNPLFNMANGVQGNTGPIATPLSGSTQKKKAAMIPLNKIAPKQQTLTPRLGSSFSRSASPFAGSTTGTAPIGSSLGRSFATGSKLHLFDSDDSVLSSGTFTPSSNSRVASLKKLVIDRKIRDQDLFTGGLDLKNTAEPAGRPKNLLKKVVSFDTGVTQIDDDDSNNLGFLRSSQRRRAIEEEKRPEVATEANTQNALALVKSDEQTENDEGYWMQPSLSKLKSMTPQQLSRVTNFTVGRRGYGQVRFEPAVDLSKINLDEIMGGIVIFDKRVCTVYSDDYKKPEEGVELNVPSVISLEDCYPQHKDTRKKITDPEHPRIAAHLGRLRNIKDTEFLDYNVATGVWIFRVQHFTTYGLGDDDDEDDFYPQEDTPKAVRQQQPLDDTFSEADADVSAMDMSGLDDTFEFKKLTNSHGSNQRASYNRQLAFPQTSRFPSNDYAQENASFLGEGSVGSLEDETEIDEPAEPVQSGRDNGVVIADEDDLTETEMDHDHGQRLLNLDSLKTARSPKELEDETDPVPKFPKMISWIDQLNSTVVPVKDSKDGILWRHDRLGKKKEKRQESPKTYDHMDLMADLYGNGEGDGADFLEV
jgi:nuclear pore complex protein Nup98-Nup96